MKRIRLVSAAAFFAIQWPSGMDAISPPVFRRQISGACFAFESEFYY